MSNKSALPDNLINRIARVHVDEREFKDDTGKSVKYSKLVLEVLVKDEPIELEFKIDRKDKVMLSLADDIDGPGL